MVNDCMKSNKLIGMVQPKFSKNDDDSPKLHEVGCMGKITSLKKQKMRDI